MVLTVNLRDSAVAQETKLADIAGELTQQLMRQRTDRRRLPKLMADLTSQKLSLRALMSRFERGQRAIRDDDGSADGEERRYFKRLRQRLHMIGRIERVLELIRLGKATPLYASLPPRHNAEQTQGNVMDAVMTALHRVVNPATQSAEAEDLGCFRDIPLTSSKFVAHAHVAYRVALAQKRARPLRFVDVGCGGGIKTLLAAELFDAADGFDFDGGYVEAAEAAFRRVGALRSRAFQANGLTYDGYGEYDVIYFFQPMSEEDGLRALEDRIVGQARPGTILIASYQKFLHRLDEMDCARIEDSVYVAGISQDAADVLREEALRIGPDVLHPDRAVHAFHVDWLRDLWLACAANGYLPD